MKVPFKIVIYIFSVIGLISTFFILSELIEKNNLAANYRTNCQNIEIGMTLFEARKEMSKNIEIDFQGFDYGVEMKNDLPNQISMNYIIDGGSYVISILIDKNTGKVVKINCPN